MAQEQTPQDFSFACGFERDELLAVLPPNSLKKLRSV